MSYVLDAVRWWPISDEVLDWLPASPEWDQALPWVWVMEGELTGTGVRHAVIVPKGIIT